MRLRSLVSLWNEFWFTPTAPTTISVFRILFGILVMASLFSYLPSLYLWYTDNGSLTLKTAEEIAPLGHINLFALLPKGDGWVTAFFIWAFTAALMLTLGLFTRFSAVLVWLALQSFYYRQPPIHNGADNIMRLISFYLIFSQAGAAFSLDRWRRVRRGLDGPEPPKSAPWAQRMIQIQLCVIYLSTAYWKALGPIWADGTALYYATRQEDFIRFRIPYLFEHLWTIKLITWSTLLMEATFPFLLWIAELRYPLMAIALFFHFGLECALDIPFFQWTMFLLFVSFIEPDDMAHLLNRVRNLFARKISGTGAPYAQR